MSRSESESESESLRPALTRIAEALENAELTNRGIGFNIQYGLPTRDVDYSGSECSTVCCIAGWANALGIDPKDFDAEINHLVGENLIMPVGYMTAPENFPLARAAAVTRYAVETGRVDWKGFGLDGRRMK